MKRMGGVCRKYWYGKNTYYLLICMWKKTGGEEKAEATSDGEIDREDVNSTGGIINVVNVSIANRVMRGE